MSFSLQLQHIERPAYSIDLFVPDAGEVQENYFRQQQEKKNIPFPHWTKLWPAALALADFISWHPEKLANKNVLELAGGLGLPGLIAARHAKSVCCSDYLEEAVATMDKSARNLHLSNFSCSVLDWNQLPPELSADVLLLSDINYDPAQFEKLYDVLHRFLQQGTVVLLTTPQRLMAKPFIERLLPDRIEQHEMTVDFENRQTVISLLELQKPVRNHG